MQPPSQTQNQANRELKTHAVLQNNSKTRLTTKTSFLLKGKVLPVWPSKDGRYEKKTFFLHCFGGWSVINTDIFRGCNSEWKWNTFLITLISCFYIVTSVGGEDSSLRVTGCWGLIILSAYQLFNAPFEINILNICIFIITSPLQFLPSWVTSGHVDGFGPQLLSQFTSPCICNPVQFSC